MLDLEGSRASDLSEGQSAVGLEEPPALDAVEGGKKVHTPDSLRAETRALIEAAGLSNTKLEIPSVIENAEALEICLRQGKKRLKLDDVLKLDFVSTRKREDMEKVDKSDLQTAWVKAKVHGSEMEVTVTYSRDADEVVLYID